MTNSKDLWEIRFRDGGQVPFIVAVDAKAKVPRPSFRQTFLIAQSL
jgi:hypothetical protein